MREFEVMLSIFLFLAFSQFSLYLSPFINLYTHPSVLAI